MPAPNSVPRFEGDPKIGAASIATANPNRDGTGTVGTVLTAGLFGNLISLIRVIARSTTTAGMIRLFLHDGAAFHFYAEIPVTAIVPSATVQAFNADFVPVQPLKLPTGWSLRASTEKAETFEVLAFAPEY